jgi:transcriptional regulator with XRE-family HTH domain
MNQEEVQARNLRYLLWKRGLKQENWIQELADCLSCDHHKARSLLIRGNLNPSQIRTLSDRLDVSEEELVFSDLVQSEEILRENLRFLIGGIGHGGKKKLAETIGVDAGTISRWYTGKRPPDSGNLNRLITIFKIPSTIDLTKDTLFLELDPVVEHDKRLWLLEAVKRLDSNSLNELFPALRKLLGD